MKIYQIEIGEMKNFTYLIEDVTTKKSIIIDPSWELEYVKKVIIDHDLDIKYIVNTHNHFDHVFGNDEIIKYTDAKIIQHKNSTIKHDISVNDGDKIEFGNCKLVVIYTPGHSKDSICLINDSYIFTGDTIFIGGCGRTDLPGGDAKELYNSIFKIIYNLNDDLLLYPGHNYGTSITSTIGNEKKLNVIFRCKTEYDFLKLVH